MKRRAFAWMFILFMLHAVCAPAQSRMLACGGSGRDWPEHMAIAEDGRIAITGYTDSTDGTLSARTKDGRTGWVQVLDQEGNALWSFCSRNSLNQDHVQYPRFNDDGTLDVLLYSEADMLEWIRLDVQGKVVSRKTMLKALDGTIIGKICMAVDGYAAGLIEMKTMESSYVFFDREGNPEERGYGPAIANSERHLLKRIDDACYLVRRDEEGHETQLSHVYSFREGYSVETAYVDMIDLMDGGAAACGWAYDGGKEARGAITRWDAQGNRMYDFRIGEGRLIGLSETKQGIAAIWQTSEWKGIGQPGTFRLVVFDDRGLIVRDQELIGPENWEAVGPTAIGPDGSLAILSRFGQSGYEDAAVVVLDL